jgi:hypothetical protein
MSSGYLTAVSAKGMALTEQTEQPGAGAYIASCASEPPNLRLCHAV